MTLENMNWSALFTKPSFLFDILCAAALFVLALYYAHKGLLATLVQGIGTLASLIGARLFADWASPQIFQNFLAKGFTDRISATITENGSVDLTALAEKYAGFLPQSLIESVVSSVQQSLDGALASNAAAVSQAVVQQVVEPLFTPIISIILFFVMFAVLRMLVSLLVTLLKSVNKIPGVGEVNRLLGFVVGLGAGAVDVFIGLCIVWALIVITGGGLPFLNETALADSFVYQLFGRINPFL